MTTSTCSRGPKPWDPPGHGVSEAWDGSLAANLSHPRAVLPGASHNRQPGYQAKWGLALPSDIPHHQVCGELVTTSVSEPWFRMEQTAPAERGLHTSGRGLPLTTKIH